MLQRIKNIYHLGAGLFSNIWFRFPSKKITVIGITGTDGKTTTTSLIYHILAATGENTSMISSVGAVIGGKKYDVGFHVTTPSSFSLQRFLRKAKDCGSKYLVLETTSHALDQFRVFGIKFDIGVLTNITHEHLDYHKTYEEYVKAKMRLLKMSRVAVVNRDDMSYPLISKIKNKISKIVTYGIKNDAEMNPKNFSFKTKLMGEFNKYNILAAVTAVKELGIDDNTIKKAILSFKPPIGRQDIVYKNGFTVMIDFAHTPNAFEVVLEPIKKIVKGRIIHVFGSAGERDTTKRPIMGKVSSKYSDVIILTCEDPRSESVEKITAEIESGIKNYPSCKKVYKIYDRKKAIEEAIKMANKGDLVLITGKAHETSMNYGKGEEKWDEYDAVSRALRLRKIKL